MHNKFGKGCEMRYIGNKTKLLNEIQKILAEKGVLRQGYTFCDIFAGTGSVGDYFKDKFRIIANDSLYAAYAISAAKLISTAKFDKLDCDPFSYFNSINTSNYTSGFCYNNFAPSISDRMYFSDDNAKKIDFIRDTIENWYNKKLISKDEYIYLIGCLIESVSKVANVAGVYSAFLRIWDPRANKAMVFLPVETTKTDIAYENTAYNLDANEVIKQIYGDILYIDPPYTPTQYVSQYHVLETIARNDAPITHGVGAHRDNGDQISLWCKKEYAASELDKLVANARFRYIVLSYSDAGIMSKELIEKILKRYATNGSYCFKKIDFVKYKNTRAVKREVKENTVNKKHYEWLFFIEKREDCLYNSPLNYIGGKQNALELIKSNLPQNINTLYDLFGGGATVGINIPSKSIIYNDINFFVSSLLQFIATNDIGDTVKYINRTINKCGLGKGNKQAYISFRDKYNSLPLSKRKPLDLYLLICFGFEHQIRFNSKLEFNNPCGNSGFNPEMEAKLIAFYNRTNDINISFCSKNYDYFEDQITCEDLVYCDPPYLNTIGAYNDGKRGFNGWDEQQERQLLDFLLRLHQRGIRFMLSNMEDRNNSNNSILNNWVVENGFNVIYDDNITKRNRQDRREILITNY